MTTNSKIGLGVGMVAVFATFVIGMYGMQSSKVASVGSYNNSAAALKSPTAEVNQKVAPASSIIVPLCAPNAAPSITVLYPNGGEVLTSGQSLTVKWRSCNISPSTLLEVNVAAPMSGLPFGFLAPNGTPNDGSHTVVMQGWPAGSDYRIIVGTPRFPGQFNNSALDISDSSNSTFSLSSPQCTINNFIASPTYVSSGGSSTLNWATSNCTNASISTIGSVGLSGSLSTGALFSTKNYILTASSSTNTVTRTITVIVGSTALQCNDSIDNDGDTKIDYPSDPGCSSITDNSEL